MKLENKTNQVSVDFSFNRVATKSEDIFWKQTTGLEEGGYFSIHSVDHFAFPSHKHVMGDYKQKWGDLIAQPVNGQVKFFLRAFVLDFQGRFEEVLTIADEFKDFSQRLEATDRESIRELPEFECHLFLEKRGETLTVRDLRDNLKSEIRLDPHHNVAILEYLLWKYHKNLQQLFTPPPEGSVPAHLLEALDQAIEAHNAAVEADRQRKQKIQSLNDAEGNSRNELERHTARTEKANLEGQEFGAAFAALQARKKKREAEEALKNAEKVDPYQEEQKRLAEEKAKREAEEKRQRDESRARLKAKSSLWQ